MLPQDKWLFQQSEKIKVRESYNNQVAWLDTIDRVFTYLKTERTKKSGAKQVMNTAAKDFTRRIWYEGPDQFAAEFIIQNKKDFRLLHQ